MKIMPKEPAYPSESFEAGELKFELKFHKIPQANGMFKVSIVLTISNGTMFHSSFGELVASEHINPDRIHLLKQSLFNYFTSLDDLAYEPFKVVEMLKLLPQFTDPLFPERYM